LWKLSLKKRGAVDKKGLLMKKQTLLIACSVLFLAACGGGSPSGLTVLPNGDLTVASGSAQKGPFIAGSTVTLNTLTDTSPNPAAAASSATKPFLAPSGKSFTLETDSTGTFDSTALTFSATEKFIQANVEGYFFDEITGLRSDDYIALRGVVDITTQKLQINILTDLAKARTVKLARDQVALCKITTAATANVAAVLSADCSLTSAEFTLARTQAEKEVLQAFNIPIRLLGDTFTSFANMNFKNIANTGFLSSSAPSDQVLLALSALVVQIGKDGAGITEFINAFEADLAADGRLDDADLKAQISRASSTVNFLMVARNMNAYYKSTKYVAADLQKWVDPSGGVNGVIAAQTEYYNMDTTKTTATYTTSPMSVTGLGNGTCLAMSTVNATSQLIATVGTTITTVPSNTSYFIPAGVKPNLQLSSKPNSLNGQAKVMMWDATSNTAAGCTITATTVQTGIYFFAATPSNLNLFATKFISDFAKCFNLTATNRVKSVDLSNPDIPAVTNVDDLCKPLAGSATKEYVNNGYKSGQQYYYLLADGGMTKTAKVTAMDVIDYYVGRDGQQVARILFTYMDRYNKKGVMPVYVTQDSSLTSTDTAGWYNTGNQQPIDINLMVGQRKYVSIPLKTADKAVTKDAPAVSGTKTLANIRVRYQSAFLPAINSKGPGTVLANGSRLSAVVITGPGLPTEGLVYIPPLQSGQVNFDFSNLTGTLPGNTPANQQPRCGYTPQFITVPGVPASAPSTTVLTPSKSSCELNWVGQTTWATPFPATPTPPKLVTTQPTGSIWLPNNAWNLMTAGTEYLFKLYYGTSTTPTYTYTKRLNTSMPDLTKADSETWVILDNVGGVSLKSAVETAGTTPNPFEAFRPQPGQTSMKVTWAGQVQNSIEISSINTNLQMAHYPRATPGDSVARGYAEGTLVPQLNQDGVEREMQWTANVDDTTQQPVTGTGLTTDMTLQLSRTISMSYRTWDGSWKSQDYLFLTNSP